MWLVNQLTASTKSSVLTEWWWYVSHQSGEHTSIVFSASFFPLLNLFFNFPSNNKPILLSFFPLCLFLNINLAVVDLLEYNDYFRVFSIPPPPKKKYLLRFHWYFWKSWLLDHLNVWSYCWFLFLICQRLMFSLGSVGHGDVIGQDMKKMTDVCLALYH